MYRHYIHVKGTSFYMFAKSVHNLSTSCVGTALFIVTNNIDNILVLESGVTKLIMSFLVALSQQPHKQYDNHALYLYP